MSNILFVVPLCALFALLFSLYLALSVLKKDDGTDKMKEISNAVKEGSSAYLNRQYKEVGIFFAVVFVILLLMSFRGYVVQFVPFAFLTGGLFSGLSGFCGMKIATNASAKTANACRESCPLPPSITIRSGNNLPSFLRR